MCIYFIHILICIIYHAVGVQCIVLFLTRYAAILGNQWVKASKEKRDLNPHLRHTFENSWPWYFEYFEKHCNCVRKCPMHVGSLELLFKNVMLRVGSL